MAYGRVNTGGGSSGKSEIWVTAPTGSTVTCAKGNVIKTAAEKDGLWIFRGCDVGTWTVNATLDGDSATKSVVIAEENQLMRYYITVNYNTIPEFTYTGEYEIVNDNDEPITESQDNFKIRFLTSGVFTPTSLNGAEAIDVFLVGAGGAGGGAGASAYGGGGGGGYTLTEKGVQLTADTSYEIVVGAGGTGVSNGKGNNGGYTRAFGHTAAGGYGAERAPTPGAGSPGANGGSGGSAGGQGATNAGSNGGNGGSDTVAGTAGGKGQISVPGPNGETGNTREFGEASGKLYAGGGGGAAYNTSNAGGDGGGGRGALIVDTNRLAPQNGEDNTGGGGGGAHGDFYPNSGNGGSGIVVIRNARGAA